ncbi:sugar O-acetyltransferase [Miniimonas sp. S16]|uniref:sugar O-acetyltransferase n=1 Tax=Miniimonas sp. S16 TaxID=2171623 RepID=UPI000D5278C1|nr:sugar O-acetyltransferase [Miniimonas sp. S16]
MTTRDYFAGDPRTNRERMLAGDLYVADDPESERIARRATVLVDAYQRAVVAAEDAGAREILADLLGSVGEGVFIKPPLAVDYGENIHVGARTCVNSGLTALDVAPITIGADCLLGPNVQLLTPTHPIDPRPRRDKLEAARPITLGDNVWLGGGVIVCPGVRIGDNTVVGAGSVVTRDLPANVVAVGNPARVIRTITEADEHDERDEAAAADGA